MGFNSGFKGLKYKTSTVQHILMVSVLFNP